MHEKFLASYSAVSCSTSPYMSEKFNEEIPFSEDIFSYCRLSWPRWPFQHTMIYFDTVSWEE